MGKHLDRHVDSQAEVSGFLPPHSLHCPITKVAPLHGF